jgi:hypothetical protein
MEREELVDVFRFARTKFWSDLDLHRCPRRGRFAADDGRCNACETSAQCEWLQQHGDVAMLHKRPFKHVIDGLELAMTSIYSEVAGHDGSSDGCGCPLCGWLNGAEVVYEELVRRKAMAGAPNE